METELEENKTDRLAPSAEKRKKGKAVLVWRALISILLLVIVISRVEFQTVVSLFTRADPGFFGIVLLLLACDRLLMAYKWNLLTQVKGIGLSVWQSFRIYLISNFFGVFLPTGIGGDVYRVYYTSKRHGQTEEIAASVILERVVGTVASAFVAVCGFTLMMGLDSKPLLKSSAVIIILGVLIGSLVAFWISIQQGTLTGLESGLGRWRSKRVFKIWLECHRAYVDYRQHRVALLVFFVLSVIEQGLFPLANYLGSRAMGLDIGLIYFIGIIPICQILMRMPISINAIGVQEGVYALFFSQFGVSVTEAISLALLMRIGHWLVVLPGGLLYMMERGKQKHLVKVGAEGYGR